MPVCVLGWRALISLWWELKGSGDGAAKAQKNMDRALELDARGFSESQIAKELGVSQQSVSRYLKVRNAAQLRDMKTLHTFDRAYRMWRNLLQNLWRLYEEAKEIAERRKIAEQICEVQRIVDDRFLPKSTDEPDHSEEYKDEVLDGATGDATKGKDAT